MIPLEKIVSLAKRRGFIYPGSEIYGGLTGTWDYGPLGVELKNNIKKAFWQSMVYQRDDIVGLDAAILMNPGVWEASGHVAAFADPLVECKVCHERFRADHHEEIKEHEHSHKNTPGVSPGSSKAHSGSEKPDVWTEPKQFNLLVEARLGVVENDKQKVYLRGEITQGVHVNFKNVLDSTRVAIPFGIAQIGKAFRNEITPGNFTFRSREFEQMELQFYIKPEKKESDKWYEYWKEERMRWYLNLGMSKKNLRFRQHEEGERAHYAQNAWDIEYNSPFSAKGGSASGGGWKEFEGIHHRGDWDLKQHQTHSGVDMTYFDQATGEHFLPWIVETSGGVDRAALFFLIDAYTEEKDRVILKLDPKLAPIKAAVFPLLANKPNLVNKAKQIYSSLITPGKGEARQKRHYSSLNVAWDDRGNIGKRYFAQDEAGTPYCITVDFETLENGTVTLRDRDSAKQQRIKAEDLFEIVSTNL